MSEVIPAGLAMQPAMGEQGPRVLPTGPGDSGQSTTSAAHSLSACFLVGNMTRMVEYVDAFGNCVCMHLAR